MIRQSSLQRCTLPISFEISLKIFFFQIHNKSVSSSYDVGVHSRIRVVQLQGGQRKSELLKEIADIPS